MLVLAMAAMMAGGVVSRPVSNLYSGPSRDADVVTQAIYSTAVTVLEERGHWLRVRTPDEYAGWIESDAVRRLREAERAFATAGRVAEVGSLFAHLYREPSVTKHEPVLTVPFETRLEVVAEPEREGGRWIQVRLIDDRPAWVQRGDVVFEPGRQSIDETITLARRFLGLPYTWGGTSSFGYDCSGFTQMLCRRRGIGLPRDAKPQANWDQARRIERSELRAGDLVYFGPSLEKINHTGYYIGNGEFIHATTNGRPVVQISRLDDTPWTTLFVAARRVAVPSAAAREEKR
ncbi:MAG TPA: glycoside hydrolase [Solibacterales bacterium]|nr:glycoside hydrolase [Bryobacterales bacterium]